MNINSNRLVNIIRNGSPSVSWRNNLKSLLEGGNSKEKIIDGINDLDVLDKVVLYVETPPSSLDTSNQEMNKPINDWLSSLENSTGGKILSTGFDIYQALKNKDNGLSATWNPWVKNVKTWGGAGGGFSFECTFNFNMGQYGIWNAKEEVVKPILNLIAPAIPREITNVSMTGPFPTTISILASLIQGGLSSLANDTSSLAEKLSDLIDTAYMNYMYKVSFGSDNSFREYNNLIITKAKANFSSEVDQYGYPISGSASLTFEGIMPLALKYNTTKIGRAVRFDLDREN